MCLESVSVPIYVFALVICMATRRFSLSFRTNESLVLSLPIDHFTLQATG